MCRAKDQTLLGISNMNHRKDSEDSEEVDLSYISLSPHSFSFFTG